MLRLHGFRDSIYYSVVKVVLLEKELPFEEVHVALGADGRLVPDPAYRDKSPIGKVPALETERGFLSETNLILDYLEDRGEGPSFHPVDPWERAKVRELVKYMELYLEVPARRLYGELSGRPVPEAEKRLVRGLLEEGFAAFERLARFDPYVAGPTLTVSDFFATFVLPAATWMTRTVYGWDTWNGITGLRELVALMNRRESVLRNAAEQKAAG